MENTKIEVKDCAFETSPTIESFTAELKAHLRGSLQAKFAAFNEYDGGIPEVNFDELDEVIDEYVSKYRPAPKG